MLWVLFTVLARAVWCVRCAVDLDLRVLTITGLVVRVSEVKVKLCRVSGRSK